MTYGRIYFPSVDGAMRRLSPLRLPEHGTVYAMAVHKSQGSESDEVLLVLGEAHSPVMTAGVALHWHHPGPVAVYTVVGKPRRSRQRAGGSGSAQSAVEITAPELIVIPQGPFIAGSDRTEREYAYQLDEQGYGHRLTHEQRWYEDERTRQQVTLSAFAIMKRLVTNRDYLRFLEATGHRAPDVDQQTWQSYGLVHPYARTRRHAWEENKPSAGRFDHPVVLVSHADANAYAAWLSAQLGATWRLPTELEWEKAARGTDGRWFPWGYTWKPTRMNTHDLDPFDTMPVGAFPTGQSPFGMLDPAGQVFEWTADTAGQGRVVVKGAGSWDEKGCGVCRPAAPYPLGSAQAYSHQLSPDT